MITPPSTSAEAMYCDGARRSPSMIMLNISVKNVMVLDYQRLKIQMVLVILGLDIIVMNVMVLVIN